MRRLTSRARAPLGAIGFALALLCVAAPAQPDARLTAVRDLANGVSLFRFTDPSLLDPPAPVSGWALRLNPALVRLEAALANDEVVGTETVADTAARHRALAAINAGFFLPNGDPAGLFKLDGRLVSDTRRARGAVGITSERGRVRLLFDRVTATVSVTIHRGPGRTTSVPVDGVDTTRLRGKLMLFTPAYHAHTDTPPGGLEWPAAAQPTQITGGPLDAGSTPIPRDGFVLSYGGPRAPRSLRSLKRRTRLDVVARYSPAGGDGRAWSAAADIIGGAGLLARGAKFVDDWTPEQFSAGFAETRHPRTMIGAGADGTIWLVTVDGRQPKLSAGMTLAELQSLARRLGLVDALNLDGGGSTTMWAQGAVVNSPSDAAGPRRVSDALLVFPVTH
jgi:hypothetical protein